MKERLMMLPLKEVKAKAITVFNKWTRERDFFERCISCSGKVEHACHYFSADKYWWLRFHYVNVNGGCRECNFYKHPVQNVRSEFKEAHSNGIIQRHGLEAFNELVELSKHEPIDIHDKSFYIDIIERHR